MNKTPTPPGHLIEWCLNKTNISVEAFADIMKMSVTDIYRLYNGEKD